MEVLLVGRTDDPALVAVARELGRLGEPSLVLEERRLADAGLVLPGDGSADGTLRFCGETVDLACVRAVLLRPQAPPPGAGAIAGALLGWAEITAALVANRPSAMISNLSKPYQLGMIAGVGLAVPETLLTTDPAAVHAFAYQHGDLVFKSISGVRSVVSLLDDEHRGRLDRLATTPTQFQHRIDGVDHRVHVIGGELFATEVRSGAVDYRFPHPGEDVELAPARLPPGVEALCRTLAAELELAVCGIDLRLTPDGQWFGLEVNPSPAFTYYEGATGQPIAAAVAALLACAARGTDRSPSAQEAAPWLTDPAHR